VLTTLGSTSVSATPGFTCHLLVTFSQIQPFLGSLGCPIGFWANLDPKRGPRSLKIKIFKKWKKYPQVFYPRNKCTKFQPNPNGQSVGCPKVFGQTHIQILAQLKLRIILFVRSANATTSKHDFMMYIIVISTCTVKELRKKFFRFSLSPLQTGYNQFFSNFKYFFS